MSNQISITRYELQLLKIDLHLDEASGIIADQVVDYISSIASRRKRRYSAMEEKFNYQLGLFLGKLDYSTKHFGRVKTPALQEAYAQLEPFIAEAMGDAEYLKRRNCRLRKVTTYLHCYRNFTLPIKLRRTVYHEPELSDKINCLEREINKYDIEHPLTKRVIEYFSLAPKAFNLQYFIDAGECSTNIITRLKGTLDFFDNCLWQNLIHFLGDCVEVAPEPEPEPKKEPEPVKEPVKNLKDDPVEYAKFKKFTAIQEKLADIDINNIEDLDAFISENSFLAGQRGVDFSNGMSRHTPKLIANYQENKQLLPIVDQLLNHYTILYKVRHDYHLTAIVAVDYQRLFNTIVEALPFNLALVLNWTWVFGADFEMDDMFGIVDQIEKLDLQRCQVLDRI